MHNLKISLLSLAAKLQVQPPLPPVTCLFGTMPPPPPSQLRLLLQHPCQPDPGSRKPGWYRAALAQRLPPHQQPRYQPVGMSVGEMMPKGFVMLGPDVEPAQRWMEPDPNNPDKMVVTEVYAVTQA